MIFLVFLFSESWSKTERSLHFDLFEEYDSLVRPVKHPNQSVVVDFEVFIAQLSQVNEVMKITKSFFFL